MTRQEAYEHIKDYLDNTFHNSNDYETYCYLRDCADTLAPPEPAPTTGLVPCGCGSKARIRQRSGGRYPYYASCQDKYCGMQTANTQTVEEAREVWNRAMGYSPATQKGAST